MIVRILLFLFHSKMLVARVCGLHRSGMYSPYLIRVLLSLVILHDSLAIAR